MNDKEFQLDMTIYSGGIANYNHYLFAEVINPHWAIIFVEEGDVSLLSGKKCSQIRNGQIFIRRPNRVYTESASTPGRHGFIFLDAYVNRFLHLLDILALDEVINSQHIDRLAELFEELESLMKHKSEGNLFVDVHLHMKVLEILTLIEIDSTSRFSYYTNSGDMRRFMPVIDYMFNHMEASIDRDKLGQLVNLHPVYFSKKFAESFGMSPMKALRKIRIDEVNRLLSLTDLSIEEISEKTGFASGAYLCRVFSKEIGMTPSAYRKSFKSTNYDYS